MALTRAYEEHEVPSEIRRMYASIRTGFDLPFVPTVFKLSAGIPQYLKLVWKDLESVAPQGTEVTRAGVAELQRALPQCKIYANFRR